MKKNFPLLALLLLTGCALQEPAQAPEAPAPAENAALIPGQAVVLLSEEMAAGFDLGDFAQASATLGIRSAERVFPDAGEFEARHRAAGLHRWYHVSYDRSVSVTKAREGLAAIDGVEAVDIPRRKERRAFFDDPYYYLQWHYRNDGSLGSQFKKGIDINVEPVWKNFTAGRNDVIVAVIDGGVELHHEDLDGVVLTPSEDGGSRNFVAGYSPLTVPGDDHGTHVAGVIGAINGNGLGVCGIAGGKDGKGGVRIMSCAIFAGTEEDPEGGNSDEDARALVWAADHGAVIANNSWGYIFDSAREAAAGARDFLENPSPTKTAIDYFIDHAGMDANGNQTGPMKGGLVLFASGNEGWDHDAPSEYERVVAVGAFGPDGKMPRYANYGPWVDILAPGGSDSEDNAEEWIASLYTDDGSGEPPYGYMSGTSMACPHVAGVAALLVSHYGGPGFTNEDLKERLLGGALAGVIDLQGRTAGGGKLDAAGAFNYTPDPVDPDKPVITFETDYTGDYRFKSHETVDLSWRIRGNARAKLPVSVESSCPAVSATCNNDMVQLRINALLAEPGDYTATIRVGDAARKAVPFTILENHAPELSSAIPDQILNAASAALLHLELSRHFTDADGETLSYEVSLSETGVIRDRLSGSALTFSPEGYGLVEVRVTAKDARGAARTAAFHVLARNTFQDYDVFPNPVSDYLNVRPGAIGQLSVTLYSRSGAQVFSQTAEAGPFQPLRIDVRGMDAGTYTLRVELNGNATTHNILKN